MYLFLYILMKRMFQNFSKTLKQYFFSTIYSLLFNIQLDYTVLSALKELVVLLLIDFNQFVYIEVNSPPMK